MKAVASLFLFLFVTAGWAFPISSQEKATPLEVYQKVTEARDFLKSAGEAGIAEFNRRDGRWAWKDTYIFVLDMDSVTLLAHPINQKLLGRNQIGLKDVKGNFFFIQFCEKAREEGGGWVEYWWPKMGEQYPSRKISYVAQVPGTTLLVGAGVYDDSISIDDLNKLGKN